MHGQEWFSIRLPLVPRCFASPSGLATDEVHLWIADLDAPMFTFPTLTETLSADEKARARRFHFERDKRRLVARRGTLRAILGFYLAVDPNRLRFCYGRHGKSGLADGVSGGVIQFNVCSSDGVAVYAFTRIRKIGVDIEHVHDMPEMDGLAAQFFSEREYDTFRRLPKGVRKKAFYNCWTRKGAFIKAIGTGFHHPLKSFDVSLMPDEAARISAIRGDPTTIGRFSIQDLKVFPGFTSALVMEGQGWYSEGWLYPVGNGRLGRVRLLKSDTTEESEFN